MNASTAWSSATRWILRIAFATRCYGLSRKYLWNEFETDSTIFSTLLFDWEFSEPIAQRVDDLGIQAMVAAALVVLLTGFFDKHRAAQWLASLALVFAIVWESLLAATKTYRGGELLSDWVFAEHGLRLAVPISLLILHFSERLQPTEWVLRIAVAATFAIHGIKAWLAAPAFVTMVIATCENLFEFWPAQSAVELTLKVVCIADLIVAVLIIARRWPRVALYASLWGFITALARYTSQSTAWPETLLRAAHVGGPLTLYLQWQRSFRERAASDVETEKTRE